MAEDRVLLEVITPQEFFYSGEVEMVIVRETEGLEGYMAGHSPALKLLKEGAGTIQEAADREKKILLIPGGYICVEKNIMIYTKNAKWKAGL